MAKMSTVQVTVLPFDGAPPTGIGVGTLSTPIGPQIVLVLSDGTSAQAVMLDSAATTLFLDKLATAVSAAKDIVTPQHEPEVRQ